MAKTKQQSEQRILTYWLAGISAIIFLTGIFIWYKYVHQGAYNTFWGGINNSLNIYGVTHTTENEDQSSSFKQATQIVFGGKNIVRSVTNITQPNPNGGKILVKTENIANPTNNFARYLVITTPGKASLNFDSIKNVWSREIVSNKTNPNKSVFVEAIFGSIPLAQLSQEKRTEVIDFMKQSDVYKVDYRSAKKVVRNAKKSYEYTAMVNLKSYIEALKKIDEAMGLKQLQTIDPAAYEGASPVELKIVVAIDSRQLLEVVYKGSSRKETYTQYGARPTVKIPETNLQRSELEQKVQQVLSAANQ